METLTGIAGGLGLLITVQALSVLVVGVTAGFVVGVLPGFSGGNAAALALPFALVLPAESAVILIAAIYSGASFAGAVPAILMNIPGTAGAAATALDGYPLALQGKAQLAIGVARVSSTFGGAFSVVVILAAIGPMAVLARQFGSRELFIVALFGLVVISSVIGQNVRKGVFAAFLGLLVGAMSASPQTGQPRFTLGYIELYETVPFVPAIVGLFALTQMMVLSQRSNSRDGFTLTEVPQEDSKSWVLFNESVKACFRRPAILVRSSAIGLGLGAIPGVGTAAANFISYADAKRRSKDPSKFGSGTLDGVIASEACDNAVASGTLVPTLALGIPGSGTAAVMLAALFLNGIQPGPRVLITHQAEVYAILLGMGLASLLLLPLGIILSAPLQAIMRVQLPILIPLITVLSLLGVFAVRNSMFDVGLTLVFGVLGFLLVSHDYPVVPLILALILGPIAEDNFLRAWQIANGDWAYFFQSSIANVLWALIFLTVALAIRRKLKLRGLKPDRV